jgi:hypothetical protein
VYPYSLNDLASFPVFHFLFRVFILFYSLNSATWNHEEFLLPYSEEKQKIISEIFNIPPEEYDSIADIVTLHQDKKVIPTTIEMRHNSTT